MTSEPTNPIETSGPAPALPRRRRPRFLAATAMAAILVVGVAAGATAMRHAGHERESLAVPLAPVAVSTVTDWSTVAVKGEVAEIFGNKFILQDASGRALVETGPQGEDGNLVAKAETVTVQGRFEHGFLHAAFIVHSDGKVVQLEPPPGPGAHHHGPLAWLPHLGATAAPPNGTVPAT